MFGGSIGVFQCVFCPSGVMQSARLHIFCSLILNVGNFLNHVRPVLTVIDGDLTPASCSY